MTSLSMAFLAALTLAQTPGPTEPRAKISAEGVGLVDALGGHVLVLQVETSASGSVESAQAELKATLKRLEAIFKPANLDLQSAMVTSARLSTSEPEFDHDHRPKPTRVTLGQTFHLPLDLPGEGVEAKFAVLARLSGVKGVSGSTFFRPELPSKLDEARTLSLEAAKRSAELQAKSLGYKLGRLLTVAACNALVYPTTNGNFSQTSAAIATSASVTRGSHSPAQSSCSSRVEYEMVL